MLIFGNTNNIKEVHYQRHIIKEVHNNMGKVWPESIANIKFYATYSDSTTYSAECDSSSELTSAETRAHTTRYYLMTSAEIGSCVTTIGNEAFEFCSSLTSITIPNSVTYIGYEAFEYCTSLTSIDIPSGVTSIGYYAFNGCTSLTSVTVESTTPPTLGFATFLDTNECPIYVPSESVEVYKAASGWSTYASRIYAIGT